MAAISVRRLDRAVAGKVLGSTVNVLPEKLSDEARGVIDGALTYALRFQHAHLGTEHLLLAILRLEDSPATDALWSAGLDISRAWIRRVGDRARKTGAPLAGGGEGDAEGTNRAAPRLTGGRAAG